MMLSVGGRGTTGSYSNLHLNVSVCDVSFMNAVQEPTGSNTHFDEVFISQYNLSPKKPIKTHATSR